MLKPVCEVHEYTYNYMGGHGRVYQYMEGAWKWRPLAWVLMDMSIQYCQSIPIDIHPIKTMPISIHAVCA